MVVDPEFVAALVRVLRGDENATDDVNLSESDGDDEDQDNEQDKQGFATEGAHAAAQRRLTALKRLWDMSVDADVCVLLCELRAVQTLEDLLLEQHAPRMQEVILGLLGNMAAETAVAAAVVTRAPLVRRLAELLMTSPHPAPLRELMRLLAVLVASQPSGASHAIVTLIVDDVLLNQLLCIWFNTLDPQLVRCCVCKRGALGKVRKTGPRACPEHTRLLICTANIPVCVRQVTRTTRLINCLLYYHQRLVGNLVRPCFLKCSCGL